MNLDISTRDKKMLLMFFGIVIFLCGYLFGYRPQMEKAESLQAQSVPVQEHLNKLLKMAEKKDFYVEETSSIQKKIDDYTAEFPADIREEDGIMLAHNMENSLDMQASSVGLGVREFVAAMDGSSQEDVEERQTLSEKNNEQTQENIDEIEGTDSQAEEKQQEAVDAAVNASEESSVPVLYRTQDTLQVGITYAGLKEMVDYLASQNGRVTVDTVNASFDPSTGNLTGTLTVNLFSMTGTSSSYTEPDAGSVAHGTQNLFGTIENTEATK